MRGLQLEHRGLPAYQEQQGRVRGPWDSTPSCIFIGLQHDCWHGCEAGGGCLPEDTPGSQRLAERQHAQLLLHSLTKGADARRGEAACLEVIRGAVERRGDSMPLLPHSPAMGLQVRL